MGYTEPKHWVSLDNSFCNLDPPCAQKVTQIEFELGSRWHFGQPKPKMNIIIYNSTSDIRYIYRERERERKE